MPRPERRTGQGERTSVRFLRRSFSGDSQRLIFTPALNRIEVGEIEENLSSRLNPAIARSIVDKVESTALGTALVAFLELSPAFLTEHPEAASASGGDQHFHSAGTVTVHPVTTTPAFVELVEDLKAKIGQKLPSYMVPRHWLAVSRIPTQGMGKADRKTLRGLAESWDWRAAGRQRRNGGSRDGQEPVEEEKHFTSTPHHDAARRAWARVLRLRDDPEGRQIADEDSFMRLGGDSIRFMKLVGVLRAEGYANVAFRDIVEATTLSACAAVLANSAQSGGTQQTNGVTPAYQPFSLVPDDHREALLGELAALSLDRDRLADVYPTAPSQDALIAPSFDSTRGHYYAQAIYSVQASPADLPTEKLQQAISALIERHETLRSVFVISEVLGRTLSVILKSGDRDVHERSQLQQVDVESASELDEAVSVSLVAVHAPPQSPTNRTRWTGLASQRPAALPLQVGSALAVLCDLYCRRRRAQARVGNASRDEVRASSPDSALPAREADQLYWCTATDGHSSSSLSTCGIFASDSRSTRVHLSARWQRGGSATADRLRNQWISGATTSAALDRSAGRRRKRSRATCSRRRGPRSATGPAS